MASDSDRGWMQRALATGALRWVGFSAAKLLLPLVVSALTFISGILGQDPSMPWMWIIMASSVAFAATSGGILWFDEMREKWRVDNKFIFLGPHVASEKTPDGQSISTVQIGMVLQSTASFPISYKVKTIRTSADYTIPNRGDMYKMHGTVQPRLGDIFRDRPIDLKEPKPAMKATLEFELVYGRQGREKHHLERAINIELRYDPVTGVLDSPFLDAPSDT